MVRVKAQEALPQAIGHGCERHRRTRMAGVGLLDGVHREGTDSVDRQLHHLLVCHGCLLSHGFPCFLLPRKPQPVHLRSAATLKNIYELSMAASNHEADCCDSCRQRLYQNCQASVALISGMYRSRRADSLRLLVGIMGRPAGTVCYLE